LTQTITDSFSVAQVTANTPKELQEKPQWVLWGKGNSTDQPMGDGKVNKAPIDPHTLNNASSTDPRTWGTFADCCNALPCALEEWGVESPDSG